MSKRIVVNVGLLETRVAVQEGNLLTELYLERHRHRSIVGSVYKGTVTNVLPGMQAAFVDIGLVKDAFLYAGDYTANLAEVRSVLAAETGGDEDADLDPEEEPRREATGPIQEMLSRNQTVLVQVSKESLGTKGARITSFISLPGRYVVYMPQARHVGVSRRIRDERERERLRAVLRGLDLPPGGFILRTNAEGKGVAGATQSRLSFLPERHTDFIFAVFAETWGFVGCLVLLTCYALLLLRGFDIAASTREPVGRLVALGVTALVATQVLVNVGMVTGLIPVVGIPLPFMSYGGSSMVVSMMALGLLLSVRMRQFQ